MTWQELAKKLEGLQTVESIEKTLEIGRDTAINYIYEMRKHGFIHEENRGKNKKRLYEIRPYKKITKGYPGLYEIVNLNSPVKVVRPYKTVVYEKIGVEEALVRAIETKNFRVVLASLALFRKVGNWYELYNTAKKAHIGRKVGALYDVSRKSVNKVRRINKDVRSLFKQTKIKSRYIIPKLKSDDFKEIEKEWNVFVPFNKEDLKRYKNDRF